MLTPHQIELLDKYESGKANSNQTILALRQSGLSADDAHKTLRTFDLTRQRVGSQPNTDADAWRDVPLGYIHEITRHECVNCHSVAFTSRIMTKRRIGSGSIRTMLPMGKPLYADLPCETVELHAQMLFCQHCFDIAPRIPQPPRPAGEFKRGTTQAPAHLRPATEPKQKGWSLVDLAVE
jgi:hypothetical protein